MPWLLKLANSLADELKSTAYATAIDARVTGWGAS